MKRTTGVIALLAALLVLTNLFWLYTVIDQSVSRSYLEVSYREAQATAEQAIALLPMAARPNVARQDLVDAARLAAPEDEPFEQDGFVWLGHVGLRFDASGRLVEARPAVDPP